MNESLDRIFPPEECLSEALLAAAEHFDINLLKFFGFNGPLDLRLCAPTHLQDPFDCHFSDLSVLNISFEGLWMYDEQLSDLRRKFEED